MDAAIVAEIGGIAGAAKTVVETLNLLRSKTKGNREAQQALLQASETALDLQSRILELKVKVLSLQEENSKLREQIRANEEGALERKRYSPKQMGQATVMVEEGKPDLWYCATCYGVKKQLVPVQPTPFSFRRFGSHQCPNCKSHLSIPPGA
jgi:hypothetical protein